MTTRTELLEAVAEALVLTLPLAKGYAAENRSMINRGVILQAEDALAALAAHRAEPAGEVVEVRGCVGVDEAGRVYGYCTSDECDEELRGQVESCGYEPVSMFHLRVPKVPLTLPTIAAEVVR